MPTERVQRMEELFGRALDMPASERSAFLSRECADDAELRREVESLLAADTRATDFLEQPVIEHGMRPPQPDVTRRIGHYEVLRRIDEGGMSEVYLAVRADDEYHKRVALKVIRQDLGREDMVRRFRTERQILAGLDHPNIAKLLDGGTTDEGRPYFVMDFIDGVPIDRYCNDNRLGVRARLELFRTVCSAVQYAHQNLVVHRDIKAGNILVTSDGVPKLLDFGIAKLLKPDHFAQQVEYTAVWMRPMTPSYASPEQIQGRPVTTASDVYSLGVLLYRLLTGHMPYRSDTHLPAELERLIVEQNPERPSTAVTRVETLPPQTSNRNDATTPESVSHARSTQPHQLRRQLAGDLDNIVLMALRKEPQRRYASVEQLAEDIRRYERGLPVVARKDTVGYRSTKFIRRNWLAVGGATAFIAALTCFAIVMALQAARIAHERDQARRDRDRAERVTAFLQEIFEVSDPGRTRGDDITAREILERGAERIARELANQPENRAALMRVIGNVYIGLGLYDRARPLLQQALEARQSVLPDDDPRVAESLADLGQVAGLMGDFDEAERLLTQALERRRARIGEAPLAVAGVLNELGVLSRLMGQFDRAEGYYRDALVLETRAHGDYLEFADTHNNLGALLLDMGRFEAAEKQFRAGLDIKQRLLDPGHPDIGQSMSNLGAALGMQGKFDESEAVLRQAMELYRRTLGDNHPRMVQALNNLGKLLHRRGALDAAEQMYREGLEIERRLQGNDHPNVAHVMSNLAELLQDQGDFNAAETLALEALDIRRRSLGQRHEATGRSLVLLGSILIATDRPREAEPLLREAIAIFSGALPEDHWREADASSVLGSCLAAEGRFEEAEPLLTAGYTSLVVTRGPSHGITRAALQRIIDLYDAWARPESAAHYRSLQAG